MVNHRTVVGTVGLAVTVLAAVAVVSPGTVLGIGPLAGVASWLAEQNIKHLLMLASLGVGLYVALAARSGSDERVLTGDGSAGFDAGIESPPERVTADEETRAGADLDADVATAAEGDRQTLDAIRDRLRMLAVATLADETDGDRSDMAAAVDTGTWTDDRTAAAFLADERGPSHLLFSRVRLWLDPVAERERRIRATVEEIQRRGSRPRRDGPVAGTDGTVDPGQTAESSAAQGGDPAPTQRGDAGQAQHGDAKPTRRSGPKPARRDDPRPSADGGSSSEARRPSSEPGSDGGERQ